MSDAMLQCRGVVGAATQNKFGFGSLKIGDTWYSTGKKAAPSVRSGQTVQFSYYLKDGKWANIKGDISVVESEPAPQGGGGSSPRTKDGYWDGRTVYEQKVRDPRIARTEALKLAVSTVSSATQIGALEFIGKAKPSERLAALREVIFAEARSFLDFANGADPKTPVEEQAETPPDDDQFD